MVASIALAAIGNTGFGGEEPQLRRAETLPEKSLHGTSSYEASLSASPHQTEAQVADNKNAANARMRGSQHDHAVAKARQDYKASLDERKASRPSSALSAKASRPSSALSAKASRPSSAQSKPSSGSSPYYVNLALGCSKCGAEAQPTNSGTSDGAPSGDDRLEGSARAQLQEDGQVGTDAPRSGPQVSARPRSANVSPRNGTGSSTQPKTRPRSAKPAAQPRER